jgi:hypothetical protein
MLPRGREEIEHGTLAGLAVTAEDFITTKLAMIRCWIDCIGPSALVSTGMAASALRFPAVISGITLARMPFARVCGDRSRSRALNLIVRAVATSAQPCRR